MILKNYLDPRTYINTFRARRHVVGRGKLYVGPNVRLRLEKGSNIFIPWKSQLHIGIAYSPVCTGTSTLHMSKGSSFTVFGKGTVRIGQGTHIYIGGDASLMMGVESGITGNSRIICFEEITIMDDTIIAWGTEIQDTDSHHHGNDSAPIYIGVHVWIGAGCRILKGAEIGSGAIVGAGSVVTKTSPVPPCSMVAGVPVKMKRENIKWER